MAMMGTKTKREYGRYYCPLGHDRGVCACPNCLDWRYVGLLKGWR